MGKVKDILRGRFRIAREDTGIPKDQQLAPLGRPLTPAEQRSLEGRNVDDPEPEVRKLTSIPIPEPRTKRPPPIIDAEVSDVPTVREPDFHPPARPKKRGWFARAPERQVPAPYVEPYREESRYPVDTPLARPDRRELRRIQKEREAAQRELRRIQEQEEAAAEEERRRIQKARKRQEAQELREIQEAQAREEQELRRIREEQQRARQRSRVARYQEEQPATRVRVPPPVRTQTHSTRRRSKCGGFCWLVVYFGLVALAASGMPTDNTYEIIRLAVTAAFGSLIVVPLLMWLTGVKD